MNDSMGKGEEVSLNSTSSDVGTEMAREHTKFRERMVLGVRNEGDLGLGLGPGVDPLLQSLLTVHASLEWGNVLVSCYLRSYCF